MDNENSKLRERINELERENADLMFAIRFMIKALAQGGLGSADFVTMETLLDVGGIGSELRQLYRQAQATHATAQGRKGAAVRLAKDEKQEAKRFVYECWQEWQKGARKYKSQAAFARDMLDKWEGVLESQPSIEQWCRDWKKDKNIPLIEPA